MSNFCKKEIKETEREIAHNILSVSMDLDTFSSSLESNSDAESPDLSQKSQKTDENSLNKASKESETKFSSDA